MVRQLSKANSLLPQTKVSPFSLPSWKDLFLSLIPAMLLSHIYKQNQHVKVAKNLVRDNPFNSTARCQTASNSTIPCLTPSHKFVTWKTNLNVSEHILVFILLPYQSPPLKLQQLLKDSGMAYFVEHSKTQLTWLTLQCRY